MKQERRSKVLFIVNILMLIMLFAIPAYAYWAGKLNPPSEETDSETIKIGKGETVETVITLKELTEEYGVLVPAGRAVTGQVEEVVLTYEVLWTDDIEGGDASHGADGTLTITPSFVGNPEGADLLNVVVKSDGEITEGTTQIIAGTPQTITLTITLDEPADLAEYNLVANETFTLAITFSVEVVEVE